jgi:hypothetical protein
MFETGWQPCKEFNPQEGLYGMNTHQCMQPDCDKTVSFCLSCNTDHHEDGYEACTCECHKSLRKQGDPHGLKREGGANPHRHDTGNEE